MQEGPLKLRAGDAEDLEVIAAILQDAIVPVCDIIYRPEDQRFILVAQRFCWDKTARIQAGPDATHFERVRCAVDVSGVKGVQYQGFDPHPPEGQEWDKILSLLTIVLDEGALYLVFAGGAKIRIDLKGWTLLIEDFGDPWPTPNQPHHAL